MRRQAALASVAVVIALLAPASRGTLAAAAVGQPGASAGGTWGSAEQVPGMAALSQGNRSDFRSVSCGSAGNCSAVGDYTDALGHPQMFDINETSGAWGTAAQIPGTAALDQGNNSQIWSVSCPSAGNCGAGGYYSDASGHAQAFVVNEVNGTWGTAIEVPGLAALNTGGGALLLSVSCASAGNCSAGGYYHDGSGHQQVFVVSERNGTWGAAEQVPGTAALNQGGTAIIFSVSCASAGNCAAGGAYQDVAPHRQAFVVSQVNGTWGTAEEVPGTAALNPGGDAAVTSVSCPAAGTCSAGGFTSSHGFVVSQANGTWGTAAPLSVLLSAGKRVAAQVTAMSCAAAGDCSAGGDYIYDQGKSGVFVVSETNGTWGATEKIPGSVALNQQGGALTYALSCGAAGNCSAGGYYQAAGVQQAFVAGQAGGTWHTAQQVPGTAALNHGPVGFLWSISCAAANRCSAGGDYTDGSGNEQAFVVSETTHA